MRIATILLLMAMVHGPAWAQADPEPVAVGAGSYASFPPKHEDFANRDGQETDVGLVSKVLTQEIYVDESRRSEPVPTNDWWTSLIDERFSGRLWAYPLAVQATEQGIDIAFPHEWNNDGNDMLPGPVLAIHGRVSPSTKAAENAPILLADFEGESWPEGWSSSMGEAFGEAPASGPVGGQSPVGGFLGRGLANSMHEGDGATGLLGSSDFLLERDYLHFLVSGGEHPQEAKVELVVGNEAVRSATGRNSEHLEWRTWDVRDLRGQTAQLLLTDQATGGWGHINADHFILSNEPTPPSGTGAADAFTPADARALRWGDWTLTMRLQQSPDEYMDTTIGRGLPLVWTEYRGVQPVLVLPAGTELIGADDQPAATEGPAEGLGFRLEGRLVVLFSPEGTTYKREGANVTLTLPDAAPWLAVGLLTETGQRKLFAQAATEIPRNSTLSWRWDKPTGDVITTWKLETETPPGAAPGEPLQGWLPHHLGMTKHDLTLLENASYPTPRGPVQLAAGREFKLAFPFHGFLPLLPPPDTLAGTAAGYDKSYLADTLGRFADEYAMRKSEPNERRFGADTYWGGKDILRYGHTLMLASETNHPSRELLQQTLRDAMVNWLTYTPGETERYFARYEPWGALIGFNPSYGSEKFTDNHFHLGYFTNAAALLSAYDPAFLKDYGDMARLVARQYANSDRESKDFPFLRTFDPWAGHSWAGGTGSGNGNNQESSSEAMQSWAGLIQLGTALGDEEMIETGAAGYAMESAATLAYWNNFLARESGPGPASFSPRYGKSIVGILSSSGNAFGTYFHGDPMFIYGIQWLPFSPALQYLARDPVFARSQLDTMLRLQAEKKEGFTFEDLGHDWGHVTLGYELLADSEGAVKRIESLRGTGSKLFTEEGNGGVTYATAYAHQALGSVRWDMHTDWPLSTVYENATGRRTVVIFNPGSKPVAVKVYHNGQEVAQVPSAGHGFTVQEL